MKDFNWTKEAEKLWDQQADHWNSRSRKMWESGSRKDIIPFLERYVISGAKVCDLGCGDGYGSLKLSSAGFKVVGVDVSVDMIQKAKIINEGHTSQFVKDDIGSLKFPDESFDAVLAINSLEWTESPLKVIEEIKRILIPNGRACVGILGPTAAPRINSYQRLYGDKVICNTMMPWEFERLACENGLKKISEFGVYKRESEGLPIENLPVSLKQALAFLWVFMLEKDS